MLKCFLRLLFADYFKSIEDETNATLEKLNKNIAEAERQIKLAQRHNAVKVEPMDVEEYDYKLALKLVADSPEFLYEVAMLNNFLVSKLVTEDSSKTEEIPGMLKGIEALLIRINEACKNIEVKSE